MSFCSAAPAHGVVRAKLHEGWKPEVERVYGKPAPMDKLADRFAKTNRTGEDETVLVALAPDGNVLGTAWPVFRGEVSLDAGFPDMKEAEAAALLLSPNCKEQLFALRDRGEHPAPATATSTGGCAHCEAARAGPPPIDVVLLFALAALAVVRPFGRGAARARRRRS